MSAPGKRVRDRWIAWVLARHRGILILAGVLTVIAGLLASRLKIESDLRALLPGDHPVIESLESIESSFVRLGSVNVLVEGGSADDRRAFADAVAGPLEALPEISDVEYRLRSDYFAEHALYYLSDEEMGELDEHVQAWTHYEACSREPDMCLGDPDPKAPERLREFIRSKQDRALGQAGFADYYEREGIDALVLLAHPTRDSSDLDFSRAVTRGAREVVAEVQAKAAPGLRVSVVGPYAVKADENESIRRDMVTSGTFGLLGVCLVLFVLFRSMRAVFTLLVPLLCGVAWSMAGAQLLLGHLNTMTSLISTVVMGMGIDAGIHFLHRARRERQEHDDHEAITRAFRGLIVPLLIASATTVGAFVVMATNSFPAFQEFGLIAVLGVALCLLAMVTVFPALLLLVGIKLPPERRSDGLRARLALSLVRAPGIVLALVVGLCGAAWFGAQEIAFENNGRMLQSASSRDRVERDTQLISKIFGKDIHAGILVVDTLDKTRELLARARERHAARKEEGSVVADFFALPDLLPDPKIDPEQRKEAIAVLTEDIPEHTWERLQTRAGGEGAAADAKGDEDDAAEADAKGDEDGAAEPDAKGDDDAAEPAAKAEDADAAEPAAKTEDLKTDDAKADDARPDEDAADDAKPDDARSPPETLTADDARRLQQMLKAEPVRFEELPPTILAKVRSDDGRFAVYAYPNFDAADILKGVEFMEETAAYAAPPATGSFVGETTVYAAMYLMMRDEAPAILAAAAGVIVLLVLIQLRSVLLVIVTLLPLVISVWWLVGLMGAAELRFTLFNIPILPAVLGIGVDNGVYLTDRLRRLQRDAKVTELALALRETGGAILAATSTTAIGFASFIIADSGGLQGIGQVAVLGICCAAAAAVLTIPGAFALLGRLRRRG